LTAEAKTGLSFYEIPSLAITRILFSGNLLADGRNPQRLLREGDCFS